MENEMSLDDEFEIRADAVNQVAALAQQLERTIKFYSFKLQNAYYYNQGETSNLKNLLLFIKGEMWNYYDKLQLSMNMQTDVLLASGDLGDNGGLRTCLRSYFSSGGIYNVSTCIDKEIGNAVNHLSDKILSLNCLPLLIIDEQKVLLAFNAMLERYRKEHQQETTCFMEEVLEPQGALNNLNFEYKDNKAVALWKKSHKDAALLITSMRREDLYEKDLIPLMKYIVQSEAIININNKINEEALNSHNSKKAFFFGQGSLTTIDARTLIQE